MIITTTKKKKRRRKNENKSLSRFCPATSLNITCIMSDLTRKFHKIHSQLFSVMLHTDSDYSQPPPTHRKIKKSCIHAVIRNNSKCSQFFLYHVQPILKMYSFQKGTLMLSFRAFFVVSHDGLFYWHQLILFPGCISNHIPLKVWEDISHPFPKLSVATIEVWEWISNFNSPIM